MCHRRYYLYTFRFVGYISRKFRCLTAKYLGLRSFSTLDALVSAYAMKHVVDVALPNEDYYVLAFWAGFLGFTLVSKSVSDNWIQALPLGGVTRAVRGAVLERLLHVPLEKRAHFDEYVHIQVWDAVQNASGTVVTIGYMAVLEIMVTFAHFGSAYILLSFFVGFGKNEHVHMGIMAVLFAVWLLNFFVLCKTADWTEASVEKVFSTSEGAASELYTLLKKWESYTDLSKKDSGAYLEKVGLWQKEAKAFKIGRFYVETFDNLLAQCVTISWICYGGHMVMKEGMKVGEFVAILHVLKQMNHCMGIIFFCIEQMVITDATLRMIGKLSRSTHPWVPLEEDLETESSYVSQESKNNGTNGDHPEQSLAVSSKEPDVTTTQKTQLQLTGTADEREETEKEYYV